jgi:predicted acylesterase/phospholipase RssA
MVVCGSNITKGKPEYFGVDTHPCMSVSLAMRISCSIPLIFTPVVFNGDYYVDAGLYSNFPLDYVVDRDPSYKETTIGLNVEFVQDYKIDTFVKYLQRMIYTVLDKSAADKQRLPWLCNISINQTINHPSSILGMKIAEPEIHTLIEKGYMCMSTFLDSELLALNE